MDLSRVRWRKASYSGTNGGGCVEVSSREVAGHRLVRDSKNPDGAVLSLSPGAWHAFVAGAKTGAFDPSLSLPAFS
jgi:hypothetical protein